MSTAPMNSVWSLSLSSQTPSPSELLLLLFPLTAQEGGLCGESIAAGKKLGRRLLSFGSAVGLGVCAHSVAQATGSRLNRPNWFPFIPALTEQGKRASNALALHPVPRSLVSTGGQVLFCRNSHCCWYIQRGQVTFTEPGKSWRTRATPITFPPAGGGGAAGPSPAG